MTQKPDIVEQAKELAASALQNMESRHIPATPINLPWKQRDKTANPMSPTSPPDVENLKTWDAMAMDVNKQPDEAQPQNLLGQRRQTREPPERKFGFSQLGQPGCL